MKRNRLPAVLFTLLIKRNVGRVKKAYQFVAEKAGLKDPDILRANSQLSIGGKSADDR